MGEKTAALVTKFARIYIPPFVRIRGGKRENVDGYWRQGGVGEGLKPGGSRSTKAAPGKTPKASKPFGKSLPIRSKKKKPSKPDRRTDDRRAAADRRTADRRAAADRRTADRRAVADAPEVSKNVADASDAKPNPPTPEKTQAKVDEIKANKSVANTPKAQDLINQIKGDIDEEPDEHDGETIQNPIFTDDPQVAVDALADGKFVRLKHREQVALLVDKMKEMVDDAKEKGDGAPNYDLCKVTVKGSNLFCLESKVGKRTDMPQFSGFPRPGSYADSLPKNDEGKVDLTEAFQDYLKEQGFGVTEGRKKPELLKASQNELGGASVAKIAKAIEKHGYDEKQPIWVSNDDYVIDGHHRWAGVVAWSVGTGNDYEVPTVQVDLDILSILAVGRSWSDEMGILPAEVNAKPKEGSVKLTNVIRRWVPSSDTVSGHWVVRSD